MQYTRTERAALNNAVWCDTVCRAHGSPGEYDPDLWFNRRRVPRFYPNAITLSEGAPSDGLLPKIETLAEGLSKDEPGSRPYCGVKDSFAALDLRSLGFDVLFEAEWLWREGSVLKRGAESALRWSSVRTAAELLEWEQAWNGESERDGPLPRVFLPELLRDTAILFMAARTGERIVAGGIANRAVQVVALTNVFLAPGAELAPEAAWSGCLAMIEQRFNGMPVVAYERGDELEVARGLGFESLGGLRVWGM